MTASDKNIFIFNVENRLLHPLLPILAISHLVGYRHSLHRDMANIGCGNSDRERWGRRPQDEDASSPMDVAYIL